MSVLIGLVGSASSAGANPGSEPDAPSLSGSLTARGSFMGGQGNDRLSSRLSLEWGAGGWSGGLTLNIENADSGGLWHADGLGSLDMSERWIGWRHAGARPVELRLGTAYGLRFGEGLILGAASFEGIQLIVDPTQRVRTILLAGATDALNPDDIDTGLPLLFPGEEPLGTNGRLAGLRVEMRPTDTLLFGVNGVGAALDDGPSTALFSVDTRWSRGIADISAEVAGRDGGSGAFVRAMFSRNETWGVSFELRHYDDFLSPVGNPRAYAGLTGGDTRNERGGLVRYDFTPTSWLSGSLSTDWSEEANKTGAKTRRIDNRLALRFVISKTTSLSWGLEHELNGNGRDGTVHSFLSTTAFKRGGRLAARLQFDRATEEARDSLRVSYRLPLWNRRITLLVDDTVQRDDAGIKNEFEVGGSFKVGDASFVTVRGTVADGPETVDVTWYQRF